MQMSWQDFVVLALGAFLALRWRHVGEDMHRGLRAGERGISVRPYQIVALTLGIVLVVLVIGTRFRPWVAGH